MGPQTPQLRSRCQRFLALLLVCLWSLCVPCQPAAGYRLARSSPQQSIKVETTNGFGLIKAHFSTTSGSITVYLPDDMSVGDMVSASVIAEPDGVAPTEQEKNLEELSKHLMNIGGDGIDFTPFAGATAVRKLDVVINISDSAAVPIELINPSTNQTAKTVVQALPPFQTATNPSREFLLPNLGQTGRPIQIGGPFDGDLTNTDCEIGGKRASLLAESPRKAVFESPQNVTGQTQITVREQGKELQGAIRNVDVRLSAPKTALTKGESTTLTIEVSGLQNLQQSVPLQLDCSGVANMAGGNQQNLQIKPGDVKANGTVTQTRRITGQRAGGFAVNANVKANNQLCNLTGQIVHVEAEPQVVSSGGQDLPVWKVEIKLQNGTSTYILIRSDQKPNLKFCNWIQINSCRNGVVPPEDRHGYELTPPPVQNPPDPKSVSTSPTPTPTPKPSPTPTDLPKLPSGGCNDGDFQIKQRVHFQPMHFVNENSGFKLDVSVITDTKGRQEARDLASWFRGISTVGGFLQGLLPKGAPDIGMGGNVASLIFAYLDAGADIMDAASRARLTSMDPTKFKIDFE